MSVERLKALLQQALVEAEGLCTCPPTSFYTALSDRSVRPKPAPLALGPAGFAFTDPTFGAKMWRVTDEHTASGKSCRVPSNAAISSWNADSTVFAVIDESTAVTTFGLNAVGAPVKIGAPIGGYTEPAFSYIEPNSVYRVGGPNSLTIQKWNVLDGSHVDVLDLVAYFPPHLGLTDTYATVTVTDGDCLAVLFGGSSADQHHYVWHSLSNRLLDTLALPTPFRLHGLMLERSGRSVLLGPRQPDIDAGVAKQLVWDTVTGTVTPIHALAGGHVALGYGVMINQDCCTSSIYDGLQWQYRALTAPEVTRDVLTVMPTPQEVYISDHANWRAVQADNARPFITATFRHTGSTAAWRAWDDEVIAVAPDGSNVWRFCHHQSVIGSDFWTQPIVHVAPNGRWATFTSTWGNRPRQDVFLVALT